MPKSRLYIYLVFLTCLINMVALLMVLDSPYLGDDSWVESTLPGTALLSHKSIWELSTNTVVDYVRSGRWYPAMVYYYPVFYYLDRYSYKVLELALIVSNILLFGYCIRLVTFSRFTALVVMLLPPLFLQLRVYHDPILSYYYLMQVEFLLILVSLIAFIRYLRSARRMLLAVSFACYTLSLLVYEAFYAFWIMHGLVALLHYGKSEPRRSVKATMPFFLVTVLNAGIVLLVRSLFAARYEGISLNINAVDWFWAFLKQSFAAVPLSYFVTSKGLHEAFSYAGNSFGPQLAVLCIFWMVLWFMTTDFGTRQGDSDAPRSVAPLIVLGIALWLLPGTLVSLSGKYQRELRWGLGYLPVYVSGFGLMAITAAGITWAYARIRPLRTLKRVMAVAAFGIAGAAVCGINYNTNQLVVLRYNYAEHFHRALMENAMHCGFLSSVPPGSFLVCDHPIRSWDSPSFFKMHSGVTLQVVRPVGFAPDEHLANTSVKEAFAGRSKPGAPNSYCFKSPDEADCPLLSYRALWNGYEGPILQRVLAPKNSIDDRPAYFLHYEAQSSGIGFAVLARIVDLEADNSAICKVSSDKVLLFVGIPLGYPYRDILVSGTWIDEHTQLPADTFQFHEKDLKLLSGDETGKVFEIPTPRMKSMIDPKSVTVGLSLAGTEPSRLRPPLRSKRFQKGSM